MKRANTIRPIVQDEYDMIRDAIKGRPFLAKYSWHKPLCEMAHGGLSQRKWIGYGCFGEHGELMAYLDYKEHTDGEIEIGICFTSKEYEGCGLMTLMLRFIIAHYYDREITIGTSEGNKKMRSCIQGTGFEEAYRTPGDRVDGSASIHYRRIPDGKRRTGK